MECVSSVFLGNNQGKGLGYYIREDGGGISGVGELSGVVDSMSVT